MTTPGATARLRRLSQLHGIQSSYFNVHGERVHAPVETLRALLASLGIAATTEREREEALRAARERPWVHPIEPVIVAWDGALPAIDVWHRDADPFPRNLHLVTEDGNVLDVEARNRPVEEPTVPRTGTSDYRHVRIHVGLQLPPGYHNLVCSTGKLESTALVIAAPTRCYSGPQDDERRWGLFAPLYALRSRYDWGAGSYGDLEHLCRHTARMGGRLAGTLPLLPCFYDGNSEPSPYLPITRLFWGEFYIDVPGIPFLHECGEAREIMDSRAFVATQEALRQSPQANYVEVQRLKQLVLSALQRHVASTGALRSRLDSFLTSHPLTRDYASFRATMDVQQAPWRAWPETHDCGGRGAVGTIDERRRFHEFVQWVAQEQMARCVAQAASQDVGLYLDLPVGVHPHGYDTWHARDSFVEDVATGAPPDSVFTTGQIWGSPPLHPQSIRESRYDYVRRYLQHHMRSAHVLRIDHVMAMHRMFCIPDGFPASQGTYLRYNPEEMYAMLTLESYRHRTILIGEDLGTVPQSVRRAMTRHRLNRMFVLYYEMDGLAEGRSPSIPANCLASLNTHDMPPFNSMWRGVDICQQADLGILRRADVPGARRRRDRAKLTLARILQSVCPGISATHDAESVLRCTLGWLGKSRAKYVMVNVEDLWLETVQQNIPGTGDAYPNWRNRATKELDSISRDRKVSRALELLREAMKKGVRRTGGA